MRWALVVTLTSMVVGVPTVAAAAPLSIESTTRIYGDQTRIPGIPESGEGADFGASVARAGDVMVVGAPGQMSGSPGQETRTGAAYVHRYNGSAWQSETKLTGGSAAPSSALPSPVPRT